MFAASQQRARVVSLLNNHAISTRTIVFRTAVSHATRVTRAGASIWIDTTLDDAPVDHPRTSIAAAECPTRIITHTRAVVILNRAAGPQHDARQLAVLIVFEDIL